MTMKMQLGRLLVQFFRTWGVEGEFDRRQVVLEFDNGPHPRPSPLNSQVAQINRRVFGCSGMSRWRAERLKTKTI